MSVAIVGAGVTGLTAAYLLLQRGIPVRIYEAASHEGGLAGSYRRNGFAFDLGPHEFSTKNAVLERLLREICGPDLIVVEKRVAQHLKGRYVRYPFQVADVLRNLSPVLCMRALADVARARIGNRLRPTVDDSFASWTYARFGKTLYDLYFDPYTRKVWGRDPATLDAFTAEQRISVNSVWELFQKTVLYHLAGREDRGRTHGEISRTFLYTRRGIGTLLEHLSRRVLELGGRIEYKKRLVGAKLKGGHVRELRFEDGSRASSFEAVVSTIPLAHLVHVMLGPRGEELAVRHELPFRGMCFVFLRVARPAVLDHHWTYYPEPRIAFQRATEFGHFGADMAPPDRTGLTLEIASDPGDRYWQMSDEQLGAECVSTLQRLGHLQPEDVLGWDVLRVRHAYPVQVRGWRVSLATLLDALAEVPNLVTIGRQGMHRYCNMDECMEMAIDVVPRLLAGERQIRYRGVEAWTGVGTE